MTIRWDGQRAIRVTDKCVQARLMSAPSEEWNNADANLGHISADRRQISQKLFLSNSAQKLIIILII